MVAFAPHNKQEELDNLKRGFTKEDGPLSCGLFTTFLVCCGLRKRAGSASQLPSLNSARSKNTLTSGELASVSGPLL